MWSAAWRGCTSSLAAIVNWRFFKPAVFIACSLPALDLAYRLWQFIAVGNEMALGVDPNTTLMHETGRTSLALLLITLSITPVRRIFKVNRLHNLRRMLGLWSFAYACLHLGMYLLFDQLCYSIQTCEFTAIWQDILKRRFIFAGQFAFVILLALALTSTTGWMRRLKRNWQRLHRLVYLAAGAALVHFFWIQKSDYTDPIRWSLWLAVLLAVRLGFLIARRAARAAPAGNSLTRRAL